MKKVILALIVIATVATACIPPIKPIPPIGCDFENAVLMRTTSGSCYWVYMGC